MARHRRTRPPRAGGTRGDWLRRALGRAGVLPPSEVDAAVAAGRIRVDGVVVSDALHAVTNSSDVEFDGVRVSLEAPTIVLAYHKPPGLIVSGSDAEGTGTVFEHLRQQLPTALRPFAWHAIGRLDRATSGLLLFTNDERLVQHVTAPESDLTKRYVARTGERVREEQVAQLMTGVTIEDGEARAASARLRGDREVEIVLTEGRHHQVRRMLNAVRLSVVHLHREAVGALILDVPEGAWRRLASGEVESALRFPAKRAP